MCANELTVRVDGLGIQPRLGRYRSFVVGLPHFLFLVRAVAPAMQSRLPYYGRGRARAIVFPASFLLAPVVSCAQHVMYFVYVQHNVVAEV